MTNLDGKNIMKPNHSASNKKRDYEKEVNDCLRLIEQSNSNPDFRRFAQWINENIEPSKRGSSNRNSRRRTDQ